MWHNYSTLKENVMTYFEHNDKRHKMHRRIERIEKRNPRLVRPKNEHDAYLGLKEAAELLYGHNKAIEKVLQS